MKSFNLAKIKTNKKSFGILANLVELLKLLEIHSHIMPSQKCYFRHSCFSVSTLKLFFVQDQKYFFWQNHFWFPIFWCIINVVCTSKFTMYWLVTKHVRINSICFGQIFSVSKISVNHTFYCTSKFSIKWLLTNQAKINHVCWSRICSASTISVHH